MHWCLGDTTAMKLDKSFVNGLLNMLGLELSRKNRIESFVHRDSLAKREIASLNSALRRVLYLTSRNQKVVADSVWASRFYALPEEKFINSTAQLFQDLFVLEVTREKQKGFFVEFGATDGMHLSNTFFLEEHYGWSGILAEPGRCWQKRLTLNRNCRIDTRCVWSSSGELLPFDECEIPELSKVGGVEHSDAHSEARERSTKYLVESVSLTDLLKSHNAPREIDYISLDTEGSEYEILSTFEFSQYDVSVITVEHNFTPLREAIFHLLTERGFVRVLEEFSVFDDWYLSVPLFKRVKGLLYGP